MTEQDKQTNRTDSRQQAIHSTHTHGPDGQDDRAVAEVLDVDGEVVVGL
jgi:hypothetical protein